MNRETPKSLIEQTFKNPKARLHNGAILIPAEPLDMEAVIQAAIKTEDEQDEPDCDRPEALFEKIGWPYKNFFAFYWQSMGPCTFAGFLNATQPSSGSTLISCFEDAWNGEKVIALIKHPLDGAAMTAFFKALIKENGAAFGVELFGSLLSNTHNKWEKAIPEKVVREAYWEWLKWADKRFDIDWHGLAEGILARAKSPIMYPLDLFKKFGATINGDIAAWLEKREEQNAHLSMRAKQAIFDAHFQQSYGPY
jgi:hypothetical protein